MLYKNTQYGCINEKIDDSLSFNCFFIYYTIFIDESTKKMFFHNIIFAKANIVLKGVEDFKK